MTHDPPQRPERERPESSRALVRPRAPDAFEVIEGVRAQSLKLAPAPLGNILSEEGGPATFQGLEWPHTKRLLTQAMAAELTWEELQFVPTFDEERLAAWSGSFRDRIELQLFQIEFDTVRRERQVQRGEDLLELGSRSAHRFMEELCTPNKAGYYERLISFVGKLAKDPPKSKRSTTASKANDRQVRLSPSVIQNKLSDLRDEIDAAALSSAGLATTRNELEKCRLVDNACQTIRKILESARNGSEDWCQGVAAPLPTAQEAASAILGRQVDPHLGLPEAAVARGGNFKAVWLRRYWKWAQSVLQGLNKEHLSAAKKLLLSDEGRLAEVWGAAQSRDVETADNQTLDAHLARVRLWNEGRSARYTEHTFCMSKALATVGEDAEDDGPDLLGDIGQAKLLLTSVVPTLPAATMVEEGDNTADPEDLDEDEFPSWGDDDLGHAVFVDRWRTLKSRISLELFDLGPLLTTSPKLASLPDQTRAAALDLWIASKLSGFRSDPVLERSLQEAVSEVRSRRETPEEEEDEGHSWRLDRVLMWSPGRDAGTFHLRLMSGNEIAERSGIASATLRGYVPHIQRIFEQHGPQLKIKLAKKLTEALEALQRERPQIDAEVKRLREQDRASKPSKLLGVQAQQIQKGSE